MAKRKATNAELEELVATGRLAENSTFDGVRYMVEPKSTSDSKGGDKGGSKDSGKGGQSSAGATKDK